MIHFNELRVTPDRKSLIIDVVVRNEKYFDNVYLDKIVIDNQDTYVDTGMPSSSPIYEHQIPMFKNDGRTTNRLKHIRLELTHLDLRRPLSDMVAMSAAIVVSPPGDIGKLEYPHIR